MNPRIVALYLVLTAAMAVLPLVVSDQFFLHIAVLTLVYVIAASSLNLILGYCGMLPLGHAAFFGIGAYCAAMLPGIVDLPIVPTILAAGLVAALASLFIGWITLRLEGHYFVLITLAFSEFLRLVVLNWVEVTNGPLGFSNVKPQALSLFGSTLLSFASKRDLYYFGLALCLATLALLHLYVSSAYGRASLLVRANRKLAQSVGVDAFALTLAAFVIGAFFAAVAGAYYAYAVSYVGPEVFAFPFTVTMLMIVAVGGRGTITGPILGSIVVVALVEYLRFAKEFRFSIFGVVLILTVLFFPGGLVSLLRRGFAARRQAREQTR